MLTGGGVFYFYLRQGQWIGAGFEFNSKHSTTKYTIACRLFQELS